MEMREGREFKLKSSFFAPHQPSFLSIMLSAPLGGYLLLVATRALAKSTSAHSHQKLPLRGYECKPNAHQPCKLCGREEDGGYFCPDETTKLSCGGASVYCPVGSAQPTSVSDGYYAVGKDEHHNHGQQICEAGSYCVGGVKHPCPKGYYCPDLGMTTPRECGTSSLSTLFKFQSRTQHIITNHPFPLLHRRSFQVLQRRINRA